MYPKPNKLFFFIVFCISAFSRLANAQALYSNIQNYRPYYALAKQSSQDWLATRRFENEGKIYFLLVNPQTLETKVDEVSTYQVKNINTEEIKTIFKNTTYQRALQKVNEQADKLQNAGITSGARQETGIALTVDLCPSHKPLDKSIFTDLIDEFKSAGQPVPIALSVSGGWMNHHREDLEWLKQLQQNKQIDITWVDHSFTHRVNPKAPLKENFLLERGTDISYEVLKTEQTMLKNGLLPSVFFRFPGLVSDQQLVHRITDFGLISIGTDAWLAKGEQPHEGSIVLIHGNGNEPVGVNDFIKLLQSKTQQIADKQWLLYSLPQSVNEEFKNGVDLNKQAALKPIKNHHSRLN